jgi:hypothetical protein
MHGGKGKFLSFHPEISLYVSFARRAKEAQIIANELNQMTKVVFFKNLERSNLGELQAD